MSDSNSSSQDSPSLHEMLSEHLATCKNCQDAVGQKPMGLGQPSKFCFKYLAIIHEWADNEGRVNNIVNHDEYGNEGTKTVHERYPEQWR